MTLEHSTLQKKTSRWWRRRRKSDGNWGKARVNGQALHLCWIRHTIKKQQVFLSVKCEPKWACHILQVVICWWHILVYTIWFWEDILENWFTFYWRWFRCLGLLMLRHSLTSIQVRLSHIVWSSHVTHSNKGQSVCLGVSYLSALIALETEVALLWQLALPAILTRHRGELATERDIFSLKKEKSFPGSPESTDV